jgi:hypothetical protein
MHSLWGVVAVFPEESVRDVLVLRIEVVEDDIGVAAMASSEDDNLKILGKLAEEVGCMRTDVDTSVDDLSSEEFDG